MAAEKLETLITRLETVTGRLESVATRGGSGGGSAGVGGKKHSFLNFSRKKSVLGWRFQKFRSRGFFCL